MSRTPKPSAKLLALAGSKTHPARVFYSALYLRRSL